MFLVIVRVISFSIDHFNFKMMEGIFICLNSLDLDFFYFELSFKKKLFCRFFFLSVWNLNKISFD